MIPIEIFAMAAGLGAFLLGLGVLVAVLDAERENRDVWR